MELLREQGELFKRMNEMHNQNLCSDASSTVSVLLSVFKASNSSDVCRTAHVIKGIITPVIDKAAYHEEITDSYGWITTLHWFDSPSLIETLTQQKTLELQLVDQQTRNRKRQHMTAIFEPALGLHANTEIKQRAQSLILTMDSFNGEIIISLNPPNILLLKASMVDGSGSRVELSSSYGFATQVCPKT